jgi:hypothetical protein
MKGRFPGLEKKNGQKPFVPEWAKGCCDAVAEKLGVNGKIKAMRTYLVYTKMDNFGRYERLPPSERNNIIIFGNILRHQGRKGDLDMLYYSVMQMCGGWEAHDRSYFNLTYLNKLLGNGKFIIASHFALKPVAMMACNPKEKELLYYHLYSVNTIADDNFLSQEVAKTLERMASGLYGSELTQAFHNLIIKLRAKRKMEQERFKSDCRKNSREMQRQSRNIARFEKESMNPKPPIMVKEKRQA